MGNIKLFENKKVRSEWNEQEEQWYFSIIDVIEVLTGSPRPRKYWNALHSSQGVHKKVCSNVSRSRQRREIGDVAVLHSRSVSIHFPQSLLNQEKFAASSPTQAKGERLGTLRCCTASVFLFVFNCVYWLVVYEMAL
jgi:hypothetical protein